MNWLLIFIPVAAALEWNHAAAWMIFLSSCLAIVPLAGWLGEATEHLAERTSEGVGGLLNATFGNAAELIIAIAGIQHGLYDVVKASLTGSIIGNLLLVLGASALAGGMKHKVQRFNQQGVSAQTTLMMLGAVALVIPAAFHHLAVGSTFNENGLSIGIALVMIAAYCLNLLFSLKTHKHMFTGEDAIDEAVEPPDEESAQEEPAWPISKSVGVLFVVSALVAWMSEILVGSVETAAHSMGLTTVFIGIIVVAIVGNAAEHSTAVMMAMKDRMDLTLAISIGSSTQIALFVIPVLVLLSHFIGPHPMDLVVSPAEVLAVLVAVWMTVQVCADGETNWVEGAQLLALYTIIAIAFYYFPAPVLHP